MTPDRRAEQVRACPKTGCPITAGRYRWARWVLALTGIVSLIWFLIRVIPKPSRAAYPCQRLTAPLASGFVVWLMGIAGSSQAYRKARQLLSRSRYLAAAVLLSVAVGAIWMSLAATRQERAGAAFTPTDPANTPIGVGKGIHPGRVVWMYEPRAALWDGKTGGWWEDANTDQLAVDYMVSKSLRTFTSEPNDAAAWNSLFSHFNRTRGLGDVGYAKGEKVAIKVNMNQDTNSAWLPNAGMPSPQMLYSLIAQLINVASVPGEAITIYDCSRYIGDPLYNKIRSNPDPNFQSVRFVCNATRNGRTAAVYDPANPIRFANPSVPGNARAYPPRCVTEAKYLINLALFRAHSLFGITACGKNLFGSIYWPSNGGWTPEPIHNFGNRDLAMGSYNCLVDLIGHPHLGGKTLLYMIDGLYAARNQSVEVIRFASFGDKWTSSIFMSQDPVAIDSVVLDFLRNESRAVDCTGRGVDNYLHEAALANNPPSGTVYDPDGDGKRLESLGVHEHWNNAVDKKYSRNLGTGNGIEMVIPARTSDNGPVQNLTKGTRYDFISQAVQDANERDVIVAAPGTYHETVNFQGKNLFVRSEDPNNPAIVGATVIDGGQGVLFSGGEDANCVLAGFTITGATQGISCSGATPRIVNCRIADNAQAGIRISDSGDPTIGNCIIEGNGGPGFDMSAVKAGRFIKYNDATIAHCVIVGNSKEGILEGKATVVNSIIYSNGTGGQTLQISARDAVVSYCDIEGGYAGTGNISEDPGFVDRGHWIKKIIWNESNGRGEPVMVWIGGDYHLREDSPCIDAGDPAFTLEPFSFDMDGQPRIIDGRADIGCDEACKESPTGS